MSTQINNSSLIERLFRVGAHFGFKKSRRHPTVTTYLYGTKDGNDILDLEKTTVLLSNAKSILREAGLNGKTVLFVGTKEETSRLVKLAAEKAEMPFVTNRWIGGMLTNLPEIKKRLLRLDTLTKEGESGELERKYTKKERVVIGREVDKLSFNFRGISTITKLPDLMVVVDPRYDSIAVKEAQDMKVPVIGIMGTDCNLTEVTYPVLVNDALQSSVKLILGELVDSLLEGKTQFIPKPVATKPVATGHRQNFVRLNN